MSLLNIHVEPQLALIGVDTNAHSLSGGNPREISKLLVLPHAHVALATRGVNKFLLEVFAGAFYTPDLQDFDTLSDWIAPAMDAGFEAYVKASVQQGLDECDLRAVELAAVGWSKRQNSMAGNVYLRTEADRKFETKPIKPWHMSPNAWGDTSFSGAPSSPAKMHAAADAQVAWVEKNHPSHPIGGRLILVEMTPDRVVISSRPLS